MKVHCEGLTGWWEVCPDPMAAAAMPDFSMAALIVGGVVALVFVILFMEMIVGLTSS